CLLASGRIDAMAHIVRAFPLITSVAELAAFAAELAGPRRQQCAAFFRKYKVRHESWYLQESGHSRQIVVVTQIDDPQVQADRLTASKDPFDVWYKQRVLAITGIDLDVTPKGPPTREVFRWHDACASEGQRKAA